MLNIAINSCSHEDKNLTLVKFLLEELAARGCRISISSHMVELMSEIGYDDNSFAVYYTHHDLHGIDLAISVGGDGTLLDTVTYVQGSGVPILGVNTGTLGFLSTVPTNKVSEVLDMISRGEYATQSRSLISLQASRPTFEPINFALNDFTIVKRDTSSMIIVHAYINGSFINSYWSDGVIVATPTGSTGYSLSVGGPIVSPDTKTFIISPISPHNLNTRPLVVSDDSVIDFEIDGRGKTCLLSLDSRSFVTETDLSLRVSKCPFTINLVSLSSNIFFDALKSKLNWGLDVRNY